MPRVQVAATLAVVAVLGVALRVADVAVAAGLQRLMTLVVPDGTSRLMAQAVWAPFLSTGIGYGLAVGLAWTLAAGPRVGLAGAAVTLSAWGAFAGWFVVAGAPASPTGRALAGAGSSIVVASAGSFVAGLIASRARMRGGGLGPAARWGFRDVFAAGFAGLSATALRRTTLVPEVVASDLALATLAGLAAVLGARLGDPRDGAEESRDG